MRDKIVGMLVGGAIGDALGMPVETWTTEKILQVHPYGISEYCDPIDHKWFTSDKNHPSKTYMPAGSITDDTQLTLATLKGMIAGHNDAIEQKTFDCYMDSIAKCHVEAMQDNTNGWGNSTLESIRRLENGVHWSKSGVTSDPKRGTGNGIPMKCSPLAAFRTLGVNYKLKSSNFYPMMGKFSAMTHYTVMGVESGLAHSRGLVNALLDFGDFSYIRFIEIICDTLHGSHVYEAYCDIENINETEDKLVDRFDLLERLIRQGLLQKPYDEFSNIMKENFGNGSCYVYDSLPFSYGFFLRKPNDVQCILDVVNAGGDTDTNASIVGSLFGSLNGVEIFSTPDNKWMLDGLLCSEELISIANDFCDLMESAAIK